eukprot:m.42395 g.42395  ORF g.42395 m.42395 type:complete len:180 (-) comp11918_c0_seq1:23-562(-)
MALVRITQVQVLNNPAPFSSPFAFNITFECLEALPDDTEWKLIYVGSAESEDHDQVLDEVLVGPVNLGANNFFFEADAPNPDLIPINELRGVTAIILTCSYREQEFVRIGYYVNIHYQDPELENEPPAVPQVDKLYRNILDQKPRVTKFNINWTSKDEIKTELDQQQTSSPLSYDSPSS